MNRSDSRTLLILRHAKAEAPWGTPDHARGLMPRGLEQARWIGEYLREQRLIPDGATISDSHRTRSTYAMLASELGDDAPSAYLDSRLYDAPASRVLSVINETPATVRSLIVVAHQPAVQELAMRLAAVDSNEEAVWEMASDYPTAGLCVFEVPGEWDTLDGRDAVLTDFITPPRG